MPTVGGIGGTCPGNLDRDGHPLAGWDGVAEQPGTTLNERETLKG